MGAKLEKFDISVPKVLAHERYEEYEYLILTYLSGKDIGVIYTQLSAAEKRQIAKEVVEIQERVAAIEIQDIDSKWNWNDSFVKYMLGRAKRKIEKNGYFNSEKVDKLYGMSEELQSYFSSIKPIAYLDDISTKNLLIHNGRLSGVIDIDWIGIGDKLTYVALTRIALKNANYSTDYTEYLLDKMDVDEMKRKVFTFYSLIYCVDFMGERGMQFIDKKIEVNSDIICRLNEIYQELLSEWDNYS